MQGLENFRPRVVLLDSAMPNMSGDAVLEVMASAVTPAALAYRTAHALPTDGVRIAVLVQSLDSNSVEFARTTVDIWYDDGSVQTVSGALASDALWTAGQGPYQITGNFTQERAQELAQTLNAGALPARLKEPPLAQRSIGPTLGEDSVRKSAVAGAIGLGTVVRCQRFAIRLGMTVERALPLLALAREVVVFESGQRRTGRHRGMGGRTGRQTRRPRHHAGRHTGRVPGQHGQR